MRKRALGFTSTEYLRGPLNKSVHLFKNITDGSSVVVSSFAKIMICNPLDEDYFRFYVYFVNLMNKCNRVLGSHKKI